MKFFKLLASVMKTIKYICIALASYYTSRQKVQLGAIKLDVVKDYRRSRNYS